MERRVGFGALLARDSTFVPRPPQPLASDSDSELSAAAGGSSGASGSRRSSGSGASRSSGGPRGSLNGSISSASRDAGASGDGGSSGSGGDSDYSPEWRVGRPAARPLQTRRAAAWVTDERASKALPPPPPVRHAHAASSKRRGSPRPSPPPPAKRRPARSAAASPDAASPPLASPHQHRLGRRSEPTTPPTGAAPAPAAAAAAAAAAATGSAPAPPPSLAPAAPVGAPKVYVRPLAEVTDAWLTTLRAEAAALRRRGDALRIADKRWSLKSAAAHVVAALRLMEVCEYERRLGRYRAGCGLAGAACLLAAAADGARSVAAAPQLARDALALLAQRLEALCCLGDLAAGAAVLGVRAAEGLRASALGLQALLGGAASADARRLGLHLAAINVDAAAVDTFRMLGHARAAVDAVGRLAAAADAH
jgi:hypothetical protein